MSPGHGAAGRLYGSLKLDGHGKTNSFRLLSLPVEVPRRLLRVRG